MEFRLQADALELKEAERWLKVGGPIKVIARTRSADQKRSYGVSVHFRTY